MKTLQSERVRINNTDFLVAVLKEEYYHSLRLQVLCEQYLTEQNCWPALWFNDFSDELLELQKAAGIYYVMNSPKYKF